MPQVGTEIVATPGVWRPQPRAFSFAWTRDGTPIRHATGHAYVATEADRGAI
jgi:hypothetical protein